MSIASGYLERRRRLRKGRGYTMIGIMLGLFIVFALALRGGFRAEPQFHGRRLSAWLSMHNEGLTVSDGTGADRTEMLLASERAIRAMGTNCFPTLLEWLQADHSRAHDWLGGQILGKKYRSAAELRTMAWWGFHILNPLSRDVSPQIAEVTRSGSKEIRKAGLACLMDVRPSPELAVSVLTRLSNDQSPLIQRQARAFLLQYQVDATAASNVDLGRPRVQVLERLDNTNAN